MGRRLTSIAVSLVVLGVIYWRIDLEGLLRVLKDCDGSWMLISLGMVIPLTGITAWRLQQLMPRGSHLGFGEANRLILVASVLNMVLPSKMGDLVKAYFMKEKGPLDGSLSLSLVLLEKSWDMLSLLLWCVFGLALYPEKGPLFWSMTLTVTSGLGLGFLLIGFPAFAHLFFRWGQKLVPQSLGVKMARLEASWEEMLDFFWSDKMKALQVASTSVFLWFLHLLQIWLFILALKAWTPFWANLALSPLALLAGLLPFTCAGIGTRDAALIAFYKPFFDAPTAAALGLLCTSRYLLPALSGLPFLGEYLGFLRRQPRAFEKKGTGILG